jgi:hypothetical protein
MGRFFMYAAEMGSSAMIYTLSFIKIGPGIQKLMGGGIHRHTDSMKIVGLLRESRLKVSWSGA